MKVYKFYKKPTKEISAEPSFGMDVKYPLYAICPDKKTAKMFRRTRNMDMFLELTSDIDKDIADEYLIEHRDRLISMQTLETFRDKNTDRQKPMYADVCMTESEMNYLLECVDSGGILQHVNYLPIHIFNEKYQEVLRYLKYDKAADFAGLQFDVDNGYDVGYFDLDFTYDQFHVFILLYMDTLSAEFYQHTRVYEDLDKDFSAR